MTSTSKTKELENKISGLRRGQEEDQAKKLAQKTNCSYLDLSTVPLNLKDLKIIPFPQSKEGRILAIRKDGSELYVALGNPDNPKSQKIIKELEKKGFKCHLFVVSQSNLENRLKYYQLTSRQENKVPLNDVFIINQDDLVKFKKSFQTIKDLEKTIKKISTTELLTIIMAGAIKMNASDIHVEPTEQGIKIRYRIDGLLQDIAVFPEEQYRFLISRIKTLGEMILNTHDISQDGRFSVKIKKAGKSDQLIDIRVSILPSGYGESIVMRLLGMSATELELEKLGIRPELMQIFIKQISKPYGMILNTGPTGSGKTTTLYACLNYVNKSGIKIITVENPIEYKLKGITQTQVKPKVGYTFPESLKAIVRQDPDILMVGEIRDGESAKIASDFALTGHIVFSTLHTNQAAGAIPRLLDMKLSPSSLSSSLNLVIAQRLVRKLCPKCKKAYQPSTEKIKIIEQELSKIPAKAKISIPKKISTFYKAEGCRQCHGLGYQERVGIFELLTVDEEIKKLIMKKAPAFAIQEKAQEQGMITFAQDALLKATEGVTSLEEVERVIGPLG